jgi:TRAP-type C4-dicarboxylate transport system substrate-binding protein
VPLFGIDKVTKYHMDVPLYATTFAWVMNKDRYNQMSVGQKKVIDDHCNTEWSLKVAGPWADFENNGVAKLKADPAREVYPISAEQLAEWRKAAEPLQKSWADNVRKSGADPDAVLQELKASLAQYKAVY